MKAFQLPGRGTLIAVALIVLVCSGFLINRRSDNRSLGEVSAEASALLQSIWTDLSDGGIYVTDIEVNDRLACRTGLDKRDGKFTEGGSFRTASLSDLEAAKISTQISDFLEKQDGLIVKTYQDSDPDSRYDLRADSKDLNITVNRATTDKALTIGVSTLCFRP